MQDESIVFHQLEFSIKYFKRACLKNRVNGNSQFLPFPIYTNFRTSPPGKFPEILNFEKTIKNGISIYTKNLTGSGVFNVAPNHFVIFY